MKNKNGSGLVFAVILLFVILAMVVTLASVTVLETKMAQKTKSSVGAFYDAESGVEWAINKIASSSGAIASVWGTNWNGQYVSCPANLGGANTCKIYLLDETGKVIIDGNLDISTVKAIRSVGVNEVGGTADTTRAIEAAVAAGGGTCYVSYWQNSSGEYCLGGFTDSGKLGDISRCGFYYGDADSISILGDESVCRGALQGNVYRKYGEAHLCCK